MDKAASAVTLLESLTWLAPLIGTGGITAILVAYLGTRKPPAVDDATKEEPSARWYFDGPIYRALESLDGIYREIKEMRRELGESERNTRDRHKEHMETMRDLSDRLPRRR